MNSKFSEYESYICEKMHFSKDVWYMIATDIEKYYGAYNSDVNYAGPGTSEKFNIFEVLVPEPFDNFIYYMHDGLYRLIILDKDELDVYNSWTEKADLILKHMMEFKGAKILDDIYYMAVKFFG